ncbi:sensor histidine kinase [Crocinitomix catalasitica]|uniref:sensor histidine kinase n=1 Tax=Crocinitomix catalasitica TaxID=184607 RepID=UPI000488DB0F|nr:histidine kinase [Crocinitomix catalasitica]
MTLKKIEKAKKEFWIANTLGWLSVYLVNIFFQTNVFTENPDAYIYSVIICGMSFIMSFFLRWVLLYFNVIERKFVHTIILSALLMIVVSLLVIFAYTPIIDYFFDEDSFKWKYIVHDWVNLAPSFFNWTLIYLSYILFIHQRKLTAEKYEMSLELKETELANLRNQLSPHFLFNAINNIRSLILVEPERARSGLLEMSDLLRYVLNYQKRKTVPLSEEMEVVQSYIELNTIHLGDNVQFEVSVDESLNSFQIPPMSIQLLLENAIKHGEIKDKAKVVIEVKNQTDFISIQVINPGKLLTKSDEGIGLKNLKHRFKDIFKEKVKFKIFEANNTVIANITIAHD